MKTKLIDVSVYGLPVEHVERVRAECRQYGIGRANAAVVRWAVVELSRRLKAADIVSSATETQE